MSDSLWPHGLYSPWNSPGQNTGVSSLSLLQGIFPTQGLNPGACIAGRFFTSWATREAQNKPKIRFFKKMSRTNGQARGWAFQTYTLDYDTLPLLRPCCPRPCHHGGLDPIFWAAWIWVVLWRADSLEKTDAGRNWGQEEKGMTEDETAGWHHRLDECELEWTPGVGDGQGGLACCDSWGRKESDTTERLNWTRLVIFLPPNREKSGQTTHEREEYPDCRVTI